MIDIIKNFIREHPTIAKDIFQLIYMPIFLIILFNKLKNKDTEAKDIIWLKVSILAVILFILYDVFLVVSLFFCDIDYSI